MRYLFCIFLSIFCLVSFAQEKEVETASINGILQELLNQISVEKGEKMDTAAIRNLFYPDAQLTVLNNADSSFAETVSLEGFLILLTDPYYEEGYHEEAIHTTIDECNGIAQVFQSFYGKDSESVERGINSYQLAYYNNRWWIVSLLWTLESPDVQLPKKYTGK